MKYCWIVLVLGLLACVFSRFTTLSPSRTAGPRASILDHSSSSNQWEEDIINLLGSADCRDAVQNKRNWTDSEGEGCSAYRDKQYCKDDGGFGAGWRAYWGGFSDYSNHGHTAFSACCACGRNSSVINFHPQKVYTLKGVVPGVVAGRTKLLMLGARRSADATDTNSSVYVKLKRHRGQCAALWCQWRIHATAVQNVFILESVNISGAYLSVNSTGTGIQVTHDAHTAAARWLFRLAKPANTFSVINVGFEKGLTEFFAPTVERESGRDAASPRGTVLSFFWDLAVYYISGVGPVHAPVHAQDVSDNKTMLWYVKDWSPVSSTKKWWKRKSAFGNASNLNAFAVLCCNWNARHKGADFWKTVEGGDMGPVGALLMQLQRLENCTWFADDASLKVIVFYERPPTGTRGIRKGDFWSLPRLFDRLLVVDVEGAFQPPSKDFEFKDGRSKFGLGYRVANHFWSERVFWMPEVKNLKYMLRLDEDSVLRCENRSNAFDAMREGGYVYGYYDLMTDDASVSHSFGETVLEYLNISQLKPSWNLDNNITNWRFSPTFYNDFEIMHIPHFRSHAVQAFTAHMIKSNGIYEWRWADGSVRFGQVAFTAPQKKVKCFISHELDYYHQGKVPHRKRCSVCLGSFVLSGYFPGQRVQQWCRDCAGNGLSRMESFGFIEEPQEVWISRRIEHATYSWLLLYARWLFGWMPFWSTGPTSISCDGKSECPNLGWLEPYTKTSFKCPAAEPIDNGGGWVCNPDRIVDEVETGEGCIVYSIRSSEDRLFEEGILKQISKECDVHVFSTGTRSVTGQSYQTWSLHIANPLQSFLGLLEQLNHTHEGMQVSVLNVDCADCKIHSLDLCEGILRAGLDVRQIIIKFNVGQSSLALSKFFQFLSSKGYEPFHQGSPAPDYTEVSFLKLRKAATPWCGRLNLCDPTIYRCHSMSARRKRNTANIRDDQFVPVVRKNER